MISWLTHKIITYCFIFRPRLHAWATCLWGRWLSRVQRRQLQWECPLKRWIGRWGWWWGWWLGMMMMKITGMKMVIIMHESLLLIIASNFAKHFVLWARILNTRQNGNVHFPWGRDQKQLNVHMVRKAVDPFPQFMEKKLHQIKSLFRGVCPPPPARFTNFPQKQFLKNA